MTLPMILILIYLFNDYFFIFFIFWIATPLHGVRDDVMARDCHSRSGFAVTEANTDIQALSQSRN